MNFLPFLIHGSSGSSGSSIEFDFGEHGTTLPVHRSNQHPESACSQVRSGKPGRALRLDILGAGYVVGIFSGTAAISRPMRLLHELGVQNVIQGRTVDPLRQLGRACSR